ncbi:uncharacterized protein STEHIDRAFT_80361 [Stereum hirsutum FP-91666 SS1]|uniref:uncharacterized protein n=1 Tax=Stereum hirsutum (strain FP-91666) TaxID=721885 RepID=UPI0004449351|nr:uncharacterized protein STEHIDRAFT_80361 [Stereum hirsutum FP-91666 SS1]EIM86148.1 hypothetical protein STEHIDRAFT_80361 [Stereum hirsutum FP-91666 SS1]
MPPRNNMNVNVGLAGGALGGGGLGSAGLGGMPGYPGSMGAGAGGMGMRPQPSPGFPQQRGAGQAFPFNTGLGQQQPHGLHQQQQSNQQQHGGNPGLPPHLQGPTAQNPNINASNAASSGAASDVGLDPSDFPALGSTPASVHASALNSGLATPGTANGSYASQAGTTPGSGVQGGQGQTNGRERDQGRDFGPDDFPALGGGQSTQQQQQQVQQAGQQDHSHPHPPGLNGVHTAERQNSLGMGGQQQQPGLLNLGPGGRGQQALQSESEKQRNYALKLNSASHAAWNNPSNGPSGTNPLNPPPSQTPAPVVGGAGFPGTLSSLQNGSHPPTSNQAPQSQPNAQNQNNHLGGPPGVPPPPSQQVPQPQQPQPSQQVPPQQATQGPPQPPATSHTPGPAQHFAQDQAQQQGQQQQRPGTTVNNVNVVPQTPAQQVLVSAADRWGLLGLLAMIKNADLDRGLLSVGTDLGTMGLDMQAQGNLYSTFITPWADSSAAHTVEPDFHLPTCYNVQPPPPGPSKAAAFSDETLFFMFYSSPRDALQEVAAQELYNRNWRYHKDLRLWLTKESGTSPSQKVAGGEHGTYTFWDPDGWGKERKDMTVLYSDLEEKNAPVFAPGAALTLNGPAGAQQQQGQAGVIGAQAGAGGMQQGGQGQMQGQQGGMGGLGGVGGMMAMGQRGAFQGVGMAAM